MILRPEQVARFREAARGTTIYGGVAPEELADSHEALRVENRALRTAIDAAWTRLMDMRSLPSLAGTMPNLGDHPYVQAQTIAGDAWRTLDGALRQAAEPREGPR